MAEIAGSTQYEQSPKKTETTDLDHRDPAERRKELKREVDAQKLKGDYENYRKAFKYDDYQGSRTPTDELDPGKVTAAQTILENIVKAYGDDPADYEHDHEGPKKKGENVILAVQEDGNIVEVDRGHDTGLFVGTFTSGIVGEAAGVVVAGSGASSGALLVLGGAGAGLVAGAVAGGLITADAYAAADAKAELDRARKGMEGNASKFQTLAQEGWAGRRERVERELTKGVPGLRAPEAAALADAEDRLTRVQFLAANVLGEVASRPEGWAGAGDEEAEKAVALELGARLTGLRRKLAQVVSAPADSAREAAVQEATKEFAAVSEALASGWAKIKAAGHAGAKASHWAGTKVEELGDANFPAGGTAAKALDEARAVLEKIGKKA